MLKVLLRVRFFRVKRSDIFLMLSFFRILISHNNSVYFTLLNEKLNMWLSKIKYKWILCDIILTTPAQLLNQPSFSINYFCLHFKLVPSLLQSSQIASVSGCQQVKVAWSRVENQKKLHSVFSLQMSDTTFQVSKFQLLCKCFALARFR